MGRSAYDEKRLPTKIDITPSTIYVGYADYSPGGSSPATSDPAWTIKRVTLVGGSPTTIAWTNPGGGTWDNRTTESYA